MTADTDEESRAEFVQSLRDLAALYNSTPELPIPVGGMSAFYTYVDDRADLVALGRLLGPVFHEPGTLQARAVLVTGSISVLVTAPLDCWDQVAAGTEPVWDYRVPTDVAVIDRAFPCDGSELGPAEAIG